MVLSDLNEDSATNAASALKGNGTHLGIKCDVSDEADVVKMFNTVNKTYNHVDVVVCNAGFQHIAPIHELSFEIWRKLLGVHLDGTFLCTREALKSMYEKKIKGKLIYIGSIHSKEASVLKAPYVSAKHGVLGLARTVAKEV